jgi:hypothetical protein
VLGQGEIIGKENVLEVCNENIEEAITEKDRTMQSYYAKKKTRRKSKSNKNKHQ